MTRAAEKVTSLVLEDDCSFSKLETGLDPIFSDMVDEGHIGGDTALESVLDESADDFQDTVVAAAVGISMWTAWVLLKTEHATV